ncbi:tetratricopeptide repeat protein [uncultured Aquimarina sp.]|uniref:tetratricopeptide repeat protein n=1 Tax=uncultured Aquimarina sp. TaxID=575652 RepID=UPI002622711E|nr:tetratricopeptide repeat protein [uncultured Aquimarina sp.]
MRYIIIILIITFSCKDKNAVTTSQNIPEIIENDLSRHKTSKDSIVYRITKKCLKDNYEIGLNISKKSIIIKRNNVNFEIPANKLVEEVSDQEMVSEFMIICNCLPNGLSINFEFDLFLYQYKSIQHRVIFEDDNIYLTNAFNFYSNRQREILFGNTYKSEVSYSYDESVDLENDTTQLIQFKNFQDENYKQNIDAYFSTIQKLFSNSEFDKLELITDVTVLELALKNVEINEELIKYNDIAYYLEQSKAYKEAVFLLEKIVKEAPKRTVAYINLGDAYWGLEEKEKAKEAYKTYIDQMKTNGKETKIPKRILERV